MRGIFLAIQYFCIVGMFVETWIVIKNLKKSSHRYLLISCVACLINSLGLLLEMTSKTQEAYLVALKFSYFGRVWVALFTALFAIELSHVKVPAFIRNALIIIHTGIYLTILFLPNTNLYYTDMKFATGGLFPRLSHGNGIAHHVQMALQCIYIVVGLFCLIRALIRETVSKEKTKLILVLCASGTMGLFFVIQLIAPWKITYEYDLTMLGFFIGTIFMLITIMFFDLLGTSEIARDFVIDRLSEGIIAVDNDNKVQYYNMPMRGLFPEIAYDPEAVFKRVSDAARADEIICINDRIYSPERNLLTSSGERVGELYALVDETDHYRYMSELEEQKAIADSANAAKSSFLANMSHEISTPINAVIGMDEMILRESSDPSTLKYASDIMSAGKTLLSLINDILDLSKIEEGRMEIIPVQYDLSSMINDMVNMISPRAEKKDLMFIVDVDPHIPHILFGDEIRIRQCAINLLTNAVKYTKEGEVVLEISHEKKDDDIDLIISVSDTGIGMKKEDLDKLFAPFVRIEEKKNRSIEGTGLGMSIVRQLLDLMDSELTVESEYGKGSRFSFRIRQKVIDSQEIGEFESYKSVDTYTYRELFRAPDARILVVDDNEVNLDVIKQLLKQTDIRVDTCTSGIEAVNCCTETIYDAIFLDHMMPDMDGIETLYEIREHELNRDTPSIALTANAVSGARERYLEVGFDDYLSKPVDGAKLERMLYGLIPEEKLQIVTNNSSDESDINTVTVASDMSDKSGDDPGDVSVERSREKEIIPAWLYDISEIDVTEGVKNGGSPEGYMSILGVFFKTLSSKADELEKLYADEDIENYTIKVHALKSSARVIGAGHLSEMALKLEEAGKTGDRKYIDEHSGELLELYRTLGESLSRLEQPKAGSDKPSISEPELKEAYQTIIEISSSMDFDLMDEILSDLDGYSLPEEDEKLLADIKKLCLEMNWDEIRSLAEAALK
ncbi:MAG: response regulator [Eubacterium sp.]|nr:response regulator [Eubacterium sp.]